MGFGSNAAVDTKRIWDQIIEQIGPDNSRAKGMLASSRMMSVLGSTVVIECPNASTSRYLSENLPDFLQNSLGTQLGSAVRVAFSINPGLASGEELTAVVPDQVSASSSQRPESQPVSVAGHAAPRLAASPSEPMLHAGSEGSVLDLRDQPPAAGVVHLPTQDHGSAGSVSPLRRDTRRQPIANTRPPIEQGSRLNERYTFDTFVIGESNRFAHAAAIAAAERPAVAYNPLFIYGGSGLGKTHLLHAIGHLTRELRPEAVVRYVSSEDFTNEFINMVQHKSNKGFREIYRSVDLLLIDDIQFLTNKEQTQIEFFHTFNHLYSNYKQIVITSDQPPRQLQEFEDRIRSRFESGLLTDVQPPDLETRIAILRKKSASEQIHVAPDVLLFIASRIVSNIRELEGALTRVIAFAQLNRRDVDLELAQTVLRDIGADQGPAEVTPTLIISETAAYFGIGVDDITGPQRHRQFAQARQIAMYICRELTDLSLPRIGQVFGNRDHTTVMYADKKVRKQLADNHQVYDQVATLTRNVKSAAARGAARR